MYTYICIHTYIIPVSLSIYIYIYLFIYISSLKWFRSL